MSTAPVIEPQVPATQPKLGVRALLQLVGASAWWTGSIFLSAGRLDWVRGWISVALWVAGMGAIGIVGYRYNPAVMIARSQRHRKDTKHFDKIFWAFYFPLVIIQPVMAGLDVVRFRWSSMGFSFVYIGAIAFIVAVVLMAGVLCVNPFAEETVRIQTDRGQTVITSGPYRFVRHPMYTGSIFLYLGNPLVLGSVWAFIVGVVIAALLIWRTSREDATLQQELRGYEEFTKQTRYRLLPGIW